MERGDGGGDGGGGGRGSKKDEKPRHLEKAPKRKPTFSGSINLLSNHRRLNLSNNLLPSSPQEVTMHISPFPILPVAIVQLPEPLTFLSFFSLSPFISSVTYSSL